MTPCGYGWRSERLSHAKPALQRVDFTPAKMRAALAILFVDPQYRES